MFINNMLPPNCITSNTPTISFHNFFTKKHQHYQTDNILMYQYIICLIVLVYVQMFMYKCKKASTCRQFFNIHGNAKKKNIRISVTEPVKTICRKYFRDYRCWVFLKCVYLLNNLQLQSTTSFTYCDTGV